MKTVHVLPIGNVNPNTGSTGYTWGIYDDSWGNGSMSVALTESYNLLFSAGGIDEAGTDIELRGNDSGRLLKKTRIKDTCVLSKDNLLAMLKRNGLDYTPLRPFQRRTNRVRKLSIGYVYK
jgi:hypothetical protein